MEEKVLVKGRTIKWLVVLAKASVFLIGLILVATCPIWENIIGDEATITQGILGAIIALIGIIPLFLSWNCGIYVTDKKVYGTTLLGKRVDIPMDSISAVSLTVLFAGVSVASSSGRISFLFIENKEEVFEAVGKLIQERQQSNIIRETKNQDYAEEIKKYKELLDDGIITQEEFNVKKKQILDI